jgi:hypothetical protein
MRGTGPCSTRNRGQIFLRFDFPFQSGESLPSDIANKESSCDPAGERRSDQCPLRFVPVVDRDMDEAARQFLEIPDDFHPACGVQGRLTMEKVELSICGVDSKLRNPPDIDPRADAAHPNNPTRWGLLYKSVVTIMWEKLRPTRQVGSDPEDFNERRADCNLVGEVHSTLGNTPLRCPHSCALGPRDEKRVARH